MGQQFSWLEKNWIKISHWEFWPFSFLYFPVFFYYAWLSLKRRSLFFFTASNPSIEFGGMLGEEKSKIYQMIPSGYLPKTKLFQPSQSTAAASFAKNLGYPLIAKPNIGERGTWVEKIHSAVELDRYISNCKVPFLLQELVNYPIELGVFYIRKPNESKGFVTSVVQKKFLTVTGDGKSTIKELLYQIPRASLQVNFSHFRLADRLSIIPEKNESLLVEPIGNHCRGTTFLNMNHAIDTSLNQTFDQIAREMGEFYFGRFDLRCQSIDDLKSMKNFKIIELNGAGAEPGHIYQPGYSLVKAYRDIFWHLNTLSTISYLNKKRGYPYWSFLKGIKKFREIRKYNRMLITP